jgi:hypothetical protein
MFDPFNHEDTDLTDEIRRVHSILSTFSPEDEEYHKAAQQLSHLYRLKHESAQLNLQSQQSFAAHELAVAAQQLAHDESRWQEEQEERSWFKRVDPSTVVTVAGNLVIAVIVVRYEQTGVISSQVRNFIKKI